ALMSLMWLLFRCATIKLYPTTVLIRRASEYRLAGGVSTIVASNSRRQKSIKLLNRPLANSSCAFGAAPAENRMDRPGNTLRSMQSLKLMGEDKAARRSFLTDLKPKLVAISGALRSASSKSVLTPI